MTLDSETEKRFKRVKNRLMQSVRLELERGDVSSSDVLAILAHCTGACAAYQDQRKMTPQQCMELVAANITAGNQEALHQLDGHHGSITRPN